MDPLDLTAASLAVEKARETLSAGEGARDQLRAESDKLTEKILAFDALPNVTARDVVEHENNTRALRRIVDEDWPKAVAAVEEARSALASAEREVERLKLRQHEAEIAKLDGAAGKEIERAQLAVGERLAALAAAVKAAGEAAQAAGEPLKLDGLRWALVGATDTPHALFAALAQAFAPPPPPTFFDREQELRLKREEMAMRASDAALAKWVQDQKDRKDRAAAEALAKSEARDRPSWLLGPAPVETDAPDPLDVNSLA